MRSDLAVRQPTRLKEKLKAGLLHPADNTDPQPGGENSIAIDITP